MNSVKTIEVEKEESALKEVQRLILNYDNLESSLKFFFVETTLVLENGSVSSKKLFDFLKKTGTPEKFLSLDSIDINLVQYLIIHFLISTESPQFNSLNELRSFLNKQEQNIKNLFPRKSESKIISYQDFFGIKNWNDYLITSNGEWSEVHLLDESLPLCKINIDQIFTYVKLIVSKQANDLATPRLGNKLILKLKSDKKLRDETEGRIDQILDDESLRRFLPSFLIGIINDNNEAFWEQFKNLIQNKYEKYRYSILYALGICCPKENTSEEIYLNTIDENEKNNLITRTEYIQLFSLKNVRTIKTLEYLRKITSIPNSPNELHVTINYLDNNLDDCWEKEIYQQMLKDIFIIDDKESLSLVNYLLYSIIEKDVSVAYSLLTLRFETIGDSCFLKEHWGEIVSKDITLFQENLTHWLNTENTNVHKALLWLCSGREINSSLFKLSKEKLKALSSTDKLFIGVKIAGFIYAKDHMQSLMFSLMESVGPEEKSLEENLYAIFRDYVIYNYRTTLDTIKEILEAKQLEPHLLKFYASLEEAYEIYFSNLNLIRNCPEIESDLQLVQHIQFYRQNLFSKKSKEVKKTGLSNLFKETPIHSLRWAIRRDNEKVHQPMPLGHFTTSTEFPSGEKLNPIYQESMRRNYQRMTKNEININ